MVGLFERAFLRQRASESKMRRGVVRRSSRWHLRRSNCIGIDVFPHIWCGIVGNQLLGPRVLPPRLNGEIYRAFLERELHGLLHDIPLATRVNLWFMHDGAPAHYCRNVRAYLNAAYPGQWIGRAGPTPWPARSPDMIPLDVYLWGRLKSLVYASAAPNVEVLQQRIEHACGIVRNELNWLCSVQRSLRRRAQVPEKRSPLPGDSIRPTEQTDFRSVGDAAEQEEGNHRKWRNQLVAPGNRRKPICDEMMKLL
ncbi:hypothetical protein ANN_24098 [Periplaneta americana]|uniref:Uncharacterized protein n=1 Tax=Periplaneta americana TaxID=6978 RepID=A0ABQ8S251_PERAM|nr:hypothetical protein ANN_24098 [Periplaneta americana]